MHSRHTIFSVLVVATVLPTLARSEPIKPTSRFTIQVAAFPDNSLADKFIAKLTTAGERPVWGTVNLPKRGQWVRIFIGVFDTRAEASSYGERLMSRGVIEEFLIRPASEIELLSRPRTVTRERRTRYTTVPIIARRLKNSSPGQPLSLITDGSLSPGDRWAHSHYSRQDASDNPLDEKDVPLVQSNPLMAKGLASTDDSFTPPLPISKGFELSDTPSIDVTRVPRPDVIRIVFEAITDKVRPRQIASQRVGGLWVTGDREEGLSRLRWIAGRRNADIVTLDDQGKVHLNAALLAQTAGVSSASSVAAQLLLTDYVTSNEGLLLLVQLAEGAHRYRLHLGQFAPTFGGEVSIAGSMNLDNNFDSRINPYRRLKKKLGHERPPEGVDCLIGINPVALWFNLRTNRLVPVAHITFHELAEAHAKIELGLEYLAQGGRQGAHNVAMERERNLESQRPFPDVVVTTGSNRVLRSEEEIRRFYAENAAATGGQR